jgi:hypothetical protein
MAAEPSSEPSRPYWRHWSALVPLVALAGFGAAWLVHTPAVIPPIDLQLTPPPQTELSEIPLPARVRSLEGVVLEPDGTPAADALVWLLSGDEPRWTYTGADGTFRLAALQRGPWDLRVLADGHLPSALALRDTGTRQEIRLGDARRAAPRLTALASAPLNGTVVGAAADLADGAEVVLTPVLPPEDLDAPLPRRARADAQGRFALPDLIAGDYRVEVLPAWARGGSWPDLARPLTDAEPRAFTHRADGSAPLTVELVCGGLQGSVLDAAGRPLEGALVLVAPADRPERPWPPASSDARGAFALRGLPAGRYALSVRAGTAVWTREVAVAAGESAALDAVRLQAAPR